MKATYLSLILIICILTITQSVINIPQCSKSSISIQLHDRDGSIDHTTNTIMCHDTEYLYVTWQNVDPEVISTYTKCNDPLYNQDAVQIFLSSPASYLAHKYYQFQVSPKGVLFLSDIYNPNGNCTGFSGNYQSCDKAIYSGKKISNGWEAMLKVKLSFIGRNQGQNYLMGNIFRIDKSTNKPTRYLAMNPTGTPTPCFHVTGKFQKFVLMGVSSNQLRQN